MADNGVVTGGSPTTVVYVILSASHAMRTVHTTRARSRQQSNHHQTCPSPWSGAPKVGCWALIPVELTKTELKTHSHVTQGWERANAWFRAHYSICTCGCQWLRKFPCLFIFHSICAWCAPRSVLELKPHGWPPAGVS
jgi:hypothetical protein